MAVPNFIKETANKIRHATIGWEITSTIAEGIEKIAGVAQDSNDTTKDIEEYIKAVELEWDSNPNKDPEVMEARGGQPRLKDRFENTDRQLEHKVGGGIKAEPEDLSAATLGLVTGEGGPINLLSVPQDKSVSIAKLDDQLQSIFIEEGGIWT